MRHQIVKAPAAKLRYEEEAPNLPPAKRLYRGDIEKMIDPERMQGT
ncbi:hypothetical protein PH5382_01512 [Phaeobacter sp. CECT 5382]|nr:hypothetical protein PH5382_01512 [Phaeobacter sp. CECT 5382]